MVGKLVARPRVIRRTLSATIVVFLLGALLAPLVEAAPGGCRPMKRCDSILPSVAIVAPTLGAKVAGVVSVSGTAADNVAVQRVEVRVDAGTWVAASGTTSWSRSIDTKVYADGPHTFSARATDTSGNLSSASVSVTVDNVPDASYVVPSSVARDCSVDVTGSLNAWFGTVPDGTVAAPSVLVFASGGCYRIDDKLVVRDRHNLVFDGNGATFKATGPGYGDRKQWQVYGGSDITFKRMTVEGVNTQVLDGAYNDQTEWQHNFDFWGTQGAVIDGVTGRYAWGDFVAVEPDYRGCCSAADMAPPRNITIRNSTFYGAGRMGISTNYVDGLTIENNTIDRVRWSTIDIEVEDYAWSARNIVIRNNTVGDVWHSFIANSGYDAPTENVTVTGNVMTKLPGTNQPPIHISGSSRLRSNWVIENNDLQGRGWIVWMRRAANITIRNNIGRSPLTASVGVHIEDSSGGRVSGNDLLGFGAASEIDSRSDGWTVCGNRLTVAGGFTIPSLC